MPPHPWGHIFPFFRRRRPSQTGHGQMGMCIWGGKTCSHQGLPDLRILAGFSWKSSWGPCFFPGLALENHHGPHAFFSGGIPQNKSFRKPWGVNHHGPHALFSGGIPQRNPLGSYGGHLGPWAGPWALGRAQNLPWAREHTKVVLCWF